MHTAGWTLNIKEYKGFTWNIPSTSLYQMSSIMSCRGLYVKFPISLPNQISLSLFLSSPKNPMRSPAYPRAVLRFRPPKSLLIQSLAAAGRPKDAIRLLVLCRSVHPDCFVAVLEHCAATETLITARRLHARMIVATCSDQDSFTCNHLIDVYG